MSSSNLPDLNATQAAIRAGYSERTANQQGPGLGSPVRVEPSGQMCRLAPREDRYWSLVFRPNTGRLDVTFRLLLQSYTSSHGRNAASPTAPTA